MAEEQIDRSRMGGAPDRLMPAKHGLYIRATPGFKLRDKRIERLARKVRETLSWIEPADYPAVRAWCEFEYLAGQVYAVLRASSVVNPAGEGKKLLDDFSKLRLAQATIAASLGMTPASRRALSLSGKPAFDLAAQYAAMDDAEVVETGRGR